MGQRISVEYRTPGLKVLTFKLQLHDGSKAIAWGSLQVNETGNRTNAVVEPCFVEQFESTVSFARSTTGGDAYYYYRDGVPCNNSRQNLMKPVIMVDGFDPNNGRNGKDIFNDNLAFGNGQNLGENLLTLGYDVIILDFSGTRTHSANDGADYLERNAMVLMELINRVNAELIANGSTEKLVVIGPSMGGLIARYALAYMEANPTALYTDRITNQRRVPPVFAGGGPSHHTRLYVSFDSPHLGANIMIGTQYFAEFFARMGNRDAEKGRDKLNSVAARQMLLDHFNDHLAGGGNGILPAPERAAFKTNLYQNGLAGSNGWPTQLRKVSMVNGSLSGTGQHTPCGDAFGQKTTLLRGWRRLFAFVPSVITLSKADVNFTPGYGGDCQVFEGTYPPVPGRWSRQHEQRGAKANASVCSLDNAPGGYYDTQRQIHSPDDPAGPQTWFGNLIMGLQPKWDKTTNEQTFIHTTSALAYRPVPGATGIPADLDHDICDGSLASRDLVCEGNTPFDAYYGPRGVNEDHVELTNDNVDFIRREILITDPVTNTFLRKLALPELSGVPEVLCAGTAQVVATHCSATAYVWTLSSNLTLNGQSAPVGATSFSVTTTSPSIVLGISATHVNQGGGSVSVVAQKPQFADSDPAAVSMRVGTGMILIDDDTNGQPVCVGETVRFTARSWGMTTPIKWFVNNSPHHNGTGSVFNFSVPSGAITTFNITAQAREECSDADYVATKTLNVQLTGCANRPESAVAVFPNPVTGGELTLTATEAATSFSATLHDRFGRLCRQLTAPTGHGTLLTTGLPTGLYFLTTRTAAGENERRTIEVK